MSAQPVPSGPREGLANAPARVHFSAKHRPLWFVLSSIALLLPCYWQPRIEAGDLSSHLYNAWLAGLIQSGRTPGVQIIHQNTNVLFDLLLRALFVSIGPAWAQRISVSLCVLVFVWGAFAFVSAVSGRAAWQLLPCLAMLAYGWVYHMGFFNFYLALGLCFWAMALLRQPTVPRLAAAIAIFAAAYTAHALPVLWSLALLAYSWTARRLSDRARLGLAAGCILLLGAAHIVLRRTLVSQWSIIQFTSSTGADQLQVFDGKYGLAMAALMLIWATCLADLLHQRAARTIPLHWCVLTAAGILILPSTIFIPGFRHSLVYIAERMSLALGVCVCVLLGSIALRPVQRYALAVVALVFFGYLFRDERRLNLFEDRIDTAVAQLRAGERVVSPILDSDLRANALTHMVDRACVGRCYSYANYEPSTAQFRIRALAPNPFVVADYSDSWDLQNGKYVVQPADLPIYELVVAQSGEVTTQLLKSGAASGTTEWHVLQNRREP